MSENTVQEIKPFDLNVSIRDPKTRQTTKVQPYIRHARKVTGGASEVLYERDGKFYHENNGDVPIKDEQNWAKNPEPIQASKEVEKKSSFLGR